MSIKKKNWKMRESARVRASFKESYYSRVYNLWLNKYEVKGVSRDEREFILKALWNEGFCAAFNLIHPNRLFQGSKPEYFSEEIKLGFAPAAFIDYNLYNRPIAVNLINERGTPYVPEEKLVVGKDVVLITCLHSFKPLRKVIDPLIDRIVDIEMTLRANLVGLKLSRLIEVSEDESLQAADLQEQLENDDPIIFVGSGMADQISDIGGSPSSNLDPLYKYKKDIENEILTFLGINNTPYEKKERLLIDEVNSNNDLITKTGSIMDDCIAESCEEIARVFGVEIAFTPKAEEQSEGGQEGDEESEEVEEAKQ